MEHSTGPSTDDSTPPFGTGHLTSGDQPTSYQPANYQPATGDRPAGERVAHPRVRLTVQLRQARAEANRYRIAATALRRAYADLVAAGWAAVGAADEGDPYAFTYLTDELPRPPIGHPLHDRWAQHDSWDSDQPASDQPDSDQPERARGWGL